VSHQPRHLRVVLEPAPEQAFPYPEPLALPETQHDAAPPALTVVPPHRVRVYLVYLDWSETGKGRRTNVRTQWPWKWQADCTCGWHCLSWSWSREYGVLQSGLTREEYVAENGEPTGGALVWALEHLAEKAGLASETNEQQAQEG
jgi:hypothetical protein